MEAGFYFIVNAHHLPKVEFDFLVDCTIRSVSGDDDVPQLFGEASLINTWDGSFDIMIPFVLDSGSDALVEIIDRFESSGMLETVLYKICCDLARTVEFMSAAYRCSPMRPHLNPAAPDSFTNMVIRLEQEVSAPPLMGFTLYDW